jgi:hypothetical protein
MAAVYFYGKHKIFRRNPFRDRPRQQLPSAREREFFAFQTAGLWHTTRFQQVPFTP